MKPYELDQKIMGCWQITSDLESVFREVVDCEKLDRDQISNALMGLIAVYNMKFSHLHEDYELMLRDLRKNDG